MTLATPQLVFLLFTTRSAAVGVGNFTQNIVMDITKPMIKHPFWELSSWGSLIGKL